MRNVSLDGPHLKGIMMLLCDYSIIIINGSDTVFFQDKDIKAVYFLSV